MNVRFWFVFSNLVEGLDHCCIRLKAILDKVNDSPTKCTELDALLIIKQFASIKAQIAECESAILASILDPEDC